MPFITKIEMDYKYELITRNLQEVLGDDDIKKIIETRPLKIYWGTATTGRPHIAYFLPILKIYDFLQAGCQVKVLLADIHAFLDNMKAPFDLVENRTLYYEKIIKSMLKSLGVKNDSLEELLNSCVIDEQNEPKRSDANRDLCFIKGSSYQLTKEYTLDLYKLSTFTTEHDAKKAGAQVVKQVSNPLLSSLIYPSMQALDEEYLDVDAQFGGVDQRKIFTYAMKHLPMIGYKKRIHLMNPMIPGLNSEKMSSSDEYSKIDLLDDEKTLRKKIRKCFCEEGEKENGIMYLMRYVIIPILQIKKAEIVIKRKDLDDLKFVGYEDFEQAFVDKKIHPCDLKENVGDFLEYIIKPIRDEMNTDISLIDKAYPKKQKFVKTKKIVPISK